MASETWNIFNSGFTIYISPGTHLPNEPKKRGLSPIFCVSVTRAVDPQQVFGAGSATE
ncbi:hypothetical protein GF1_15330 [Desulfolithobacter dissulfuricans]|uniref:Uncharacterized protein n=1 Tax=Desulfolithobacter dissulfuricans TaxID=2795293 RepID=A0A915U5J8_9BACT|nr:hypothetical protein GF1_15330 [Desulfolithobacter dissulfuricans]